MAARRRLRFDPRRLEQTPPRKEPSFEHECPVCGRKAQVFGEYVTEMRNPKWTCACGAAGFAWLKEQKIELVPLCWSNAFEPPPIPRRDMRGLLLEPLA